MRGGSNFYEAAADGDFENIPNHNNNNGNNGHGNPFYNPFCRAISCDDPCGNTSDMQTYFADICTLAENGAMGNLPCDDGYECQGCGSEMPNAYFCKLEEDSPSVDTTEQ